MKITFSNCLLIFLLMMLCKVVLVPARTKAEQNADEKILIALIKQAVNAQANFDETQLDRIYASDYVEISPIGEIDPREKAIGFYKPQVNNSGNQAKTIAVVDEFTVRNYGDFAAIIARITFSQTGNEAPSRPPASFRATYVCRKENGTWKISSVQVTGIRPPRPDLTK